MADSPPDIPGWLKKARDWAKDAGDKIQANAEELSSQVTESEAWDRAKGAADVAKLKAAEAAKAAQQKTKETTEKAQTLIASLGNAAGDVDDPHALARRFLEALETVEGQLDREADAVAIGYLSGAGAGVAGMSGTEIFYLRPDGPVQAHLRVSQVTGREARLSVGASTGAYVACFYGPRELLSRPARRRGVDAEVLVASLGFLRWEVNEARAGGWMAGLNAGVGLGVPIAGNFSAFDFDEQPIGGVKLDTADSDRIEEIIVGAQDRAWRRRIAQAL